MEMKIEDPRGFAAEISARIKRTGVDGHMLIHEVRNSKHASSKMRHLKDSSRLLARIAALPFNRFLINDVGQLRQKYNIPTRELDDEDQRILLGLWTDDTDDSEIEENMYDNVQEDPPPEGWVFKFIPDPDPGYKWYLVETRTCFNNSVAFYYNTLSNKSALFPIDELTLAGFEIPYWRSTWTRRFKKCRMETLLDTKLPLELDIIAILRKYNLPLFVFYNILDYTLSGRRCDLVWGLILLPEARLYFNQLTGEDELTVAIPLHPWDNQDSWNSRWRSVKRALQDVRISRGINEPSTKRASIGSYWQQVVRSAEWYKLSEVQGLGPTKALARWEEIYPDRRGECDQSTVTKAIKEFTKITSQ